MAGLARRSLATLTTFVLLAAAGFTLGALAGILWEQPRLILSYLTGGTTEIAWRGEGDAELPDVAAGPDAIAPVEVAAKSQSEPAAGTEKSEKPAAPKVAAPQPKKVPGTTARPAPPAPAAPAPPLAPKPTGRYAIQVGAFGNSESAEELASRLEEKGYDAYVTPGAGGEKARWRVRVGPLPDKPSAESLAARLKKDEKLPTWVLKEAGS